MLRVRRRPRARALVLAEARGLVRATRRGGPRGDVRDALVDGVPYRFVEPALAASRRARTRRFPHVTFVPCPACVKGASSPAAKEEARRRALNPSP